VILIKNRKYLKWLVGFGKIKGSILYFLLTSGAIILFYTSYCLVIKLFGEKGFFYIFQNNHQGLLAYIAITLLSSWHFYDDALKKISEYEQLQRKGLTEADIKRIEFIKQWEKDRKAGIIKYSFYNRGIIVGLLLFFPISLIAFMVIGDWLSFFPEPANMTSLIANCLIIAYLFGVFIYRIRWTLNERKFIRLTDPIR
jgi:hypothetical protein